MEGKWRRELNMEHLKKGKQYSVLGLNIVQVKKKSYNFASPLLPPHLKGGS